MSGNQNLYCSGNQPSSISQNARGDAMPMRMVPVAFEGYDMTDVCFKVVAFDANSAEITISTVVNVYLWDQMAPLIRQALVAMDLEGDEK